MQALATILFFIVFIQLFIALTLYIWVTIYNYVKKGRPDEPAPVKNVHESEPSGTGVGMVKINGVVHIEKDEHS